MSQQQVTDIAGILSGKGVPNGQIRSAGTEQAAGAPGAPRAAVAGNRRGAAPGTAHAASAGANAPGDATDVDFREQGAGTGEGRARGRSRRDDRDGGAEDEQHDASGSEAEDDDDQVDDQDQDAQSGDDDPPYTLKELAAHLKVPVKSLYDVVIPLGDGETAKLGEFKDLVNSGREARQELEQLQSGIEAKENDLLVKRHETMQILRALGGQVAPQAKAYLEQMDQREMAFERDALHAAMPQWSNPAVFEADKAAILEWGAKKYGFSKRDIESIRDHRLMKAFADTAKAWKTGQAALKQSREGGTGSNVKSAPGPRKPNSSESLRTTLARAQAPDASKKDKLAGISALLNR